MTKESFLIISIELGDGNVSQAELLRLRPKPVFANDGVLAGPVPREFSRLVVADSEGISHLLSIDLREGRLTNIKIDDPRIDWSNVKHLVEDC